MPNAATARSILVADSVLSASHAAARSAGLRYVSDGAAGIRRERCALGFRYVDAEGRVVRDRAELRETVARRLGNTRAVCRRCYVHPAVLDAYRDGTLAAMMRRRDRGPRGGLRAHEVGLLRVLRRPARCDGTLRASG